MNETINQDVLDEQEQSNRFLKRKLQQREDDLLLLKESMASTINQLTEELRGSGEEIIEVVSKIEPSKRMDIDYCSGDFDQEDSNECQFQPHFIVTLIDSSHSESIRNCHIYCCFK